MRKITIRWSVWLGEYDANEFPAAAVYDREAGIVRWDAELDGTGVVHDANGVSVELSLIISEDTNLKQISFG